MGFLDGLFETKARSNTSNGGAIQGSSDSINRALGASKSIVGTTNQPMAGVGAWDGEQAVRRGYENVIWVFRAVDAIAANQAGLQIQLRKGLDRTSGEVIDDKRLHNLLNFRTNSYESAWQFRYRLSTQLLLSRRGAFIEVVKGKDGRPTELHLLPVGKTKPIPDPSKFVSGYQIERSDNKVDTLDPERVIWMRMKPHPIDPYAQMTPLVAAGIEADTDYLARVFNRNFLAADGRPGMLITVDPGEQPMSLEDQEILKQRFNGGPVSAGQTTVIEGRGISAQDMAATPRDTQWGELLATSKERILMAFGTPETVMGNASGRTFDNADAERENWWMDTMVQHCNNIAFGFDPLSGDIQDDTVFGYDYSTVDVLQRAAATKREEWRNEFQGGIKTLDEYFEAAGEDTWDVPATRLLYFNNGYIVGKTPEDQAEADKIMQKLQGAGMMPGGMPGAGGVPGQMGANAVAGAMQGMAQAQRTWGNDIAARATTLANKSDRKVEVKTAPRRREHKARPAKRETPRGSDSTDERKSLEDFTLGVLESWDARQAVVVTDRLDHAKFRKGTRHWEGSTEHTKVVDPSYVVDVDKWAEELRTTLEKRVAASVERVTTRSTTELIKNGVISRMIEDGETVNRGRGVSRLFPTDADAQAAKAEIVAEVMVKVNNAINNHAKRIEDTIRKMDQDGASLPQIKRAVRKMISSRQSWRTLLAGNISTHAVEAAQKLVYERTNKRMTPIWRAHEDERTRSTHRVADGRKPNILGSFRVGQAYLKYPGDPKGPPEEVINCRCHLEWVPNLGAQK